MLDGLEPQAAILIILGALAGGFVNGLTGFGTGLSAMPFWLNAVSAPAAAQLAAAGGVAGQLSTLRSVWHVIEWRKLAPMLVAGLIGVPLGALALPWIDAATFKRAVAVILIAYSAVMLAANGRFRLQSGGSSPIAEALIGFGAGLMGGIAGLSGPLPTVWAALHGWSKEKRRGVFQAFNGTILGAVLIAHLAQGLVAPDFWRMLALALPGTFIGVFAGQAIYRRLDDHRFDRAVLLILLAAGLGLLMTGH